MNEKGSITFPGRIGLQQRVLPTYRVQFFDALAMACQGGLSVFAGLPRPEEAITTTTHLEVARFVKARNRHFLEASSPLYLCWQGGLSGWVKEWQPDVLIVEANPRYPSTRLAVRWMKRRHRPVIGWGLGAPGADNVSSGGMTHRLQSWERMNFLHSLDGLIAYSRRGAEEYKSLGYPAERLMVAPNAVSPRSMVTLPERSNDYKGQPCVLFIGRLLERKRIDNLIRACAGLPPDLQPRLLIVGEGPAGEGLKALAREIYPRAEFVGSRHGAQLEPYFASADLFVLPGMGGLAV